MVAKTRKLCGLLGLSAAVLLMSGCSSTPRGLQHVPAAPTAVQDEAQSAPAHSLAATIGAQEVGSMAIVQPTPIGLAEATVQSTYMNALGEQCKKVQLKNQSGEMKCGVCLGKDGVWRYVPLAQ